ncbi:MAG: cyclic pyranopterin monophosphate synthase MoaC [Firmicutes bacterium]|nr:cyclic pyranopterin monophosphate synthase MoaC [Bacillota bacterium]
MAGTDEHFPHLDSGGHVHLVDVADKPVSRRRAVATGRLMTRADVVALVKAGRAPKGDVLAVARVAAIQAVKRTSEWIPLAHPVPVEHIAVEIGLDADAFWVQVAVETTAKTGVEMEALTGVSAALLTLYDMLKAQDRGMVLTDIQLEEKTGGRRGEFHRQHSRSTHHSSDSD